jgi:hypothetical protein
LKNLFFIVIIFVMTSCNSLKLDKSVTSVDKDTAEFNSKFSHTGPDRVSYFVSEDFVADALNDYTIAMINKEFSSVLKCSKESVVNRHDPAVIDTIYTFSNPQNKIQIYRANQDEFIITFDVTDSLFNLAGNIKPGITKDVFSRKFNITEPVNSKVQIANSESSMKFMFYFENERLKRINSYLYLD